jgi:hypothetical protein
MFLSEDITNRMSDLVKKVLQIPDISFVNVERRESTRENVPGIVVCECRNHEDKSKTLKAKNKLGETLFYKNVYFNSYQTKEERQLSTNMRLLVKARNNGRSNLKVVGTRVFESGYTGNQSLGNAGNKNSLGSAGFRNGGAASAGASNDIDGNSYKDQGNGNGAWCGRRGNNRGGNRGNRGGQRQSLGQRGHR